MVEEGFKGPIAKFFNEDEVASIKSTTLEAEVGDLLLFVADKKSVVADSFRSITFTLRKRT